MCDSSFLHTHLYFHQVQLVLPVLCRQIIPWGQTAQKVPKVQLVQVDLYFLWVQWRRTDQVVRDYQLGLPVQQVRYLHQLRVVQVDLEVLGILWLLLVQSFQRVQAVPVAQEARVDQMAQMDQVDQSLLKWGKIVLNYSTFLSK